MRAHWLLTVWLVGCVPTAPSTSSPEPPPPGSALPSGAGGPSDAPAGGPEGASPPPGGQGEPGSAPAMPEGANPDQPCGDGVCDGPEQEDPTLCPRDCQDAPATGSDWCGDGVCDAKEQADASCAKDCAGKMPTQGEAAPGPQGQDGLPPATGKVENPPPPALPAAEAPPAQ